MGDMGREWRKAAYHVAVSRMHEEACVSALTEAKVAVERPLPDDVEQARHHAVRRAFLVNVAMAHAELHKKHSDLAQTFDYETTRHNLHALKEQIEHGMLNPKNFREVCRLMDRFGETQAAAG